jgi:hypothetical protein
MDTSATKPREAVRLPKTARGLHPAILLVLLAWLLAIAGCDTIKTASPASPPAASHPSTTNAPAVAVSTPTPPDKTPKPGQGLSQAAPRVNDSKPASAPAPRGAEQLMAGRTAAPSRPAAPAAPTAPAPVSGFVSSSSPTADAATGPAAPPVKELIFKGPPRQFHKFGNRGKNVVLALVGLGAVALVVVAVRAQAKRRQFHGPAKDELSFPRELTLRESPEPEPLDNR